MTVKELLESTHANIKIVVYQPCIKEIDPCNYPVKRYQGERTVALASNQNYLQFNVTNFKVENSNLIITCEPNEEQRQKIIDTYLA